MPPLNVPPRRPEGAEDIRDFQAWHEGVLRGSVFTAREKNSKVVEDFFDALPDGHVRDSAHQIIFGWYAGVVDESPTAESLRL